jgi:flagellar basal-body rod protein FlgB
MPGEDVPDAMAIADIPLFSMLRTRMHWHQERQRILAENVSNADTARFRPRDLAPPQFNRGPAGLAQLALSRTEGLHLAGTAGPAGRFNNTVAGGYEVRPTGNAVNLEDEMIKVAANQMDYQAVTTLYARSLGLFKAAIGKR